MLVLIYLDSNIVIYLADLVVEFAAIEAPRRKKMDESELIVLPFRRLGKRPMRGAAAGVVPLGCTTRLYGLRLF